MAQTTNTPGGPGAIGHETLDPAAARPDPAHPVRDAPPGYELGELVGAGGMGVVYRARDVGLGRDVAVKLLRAGSAPDSPQTRRFLREARITGQLQHPGVPAVYQAGTTPAGRPYLAMKLIKGDTLDDKLGRGEPVSALAVFEAICQAVAYAHAHGVVHRDLKPANVMVGAFGEVQVMDWGLAKVLGDGTDAAGNPGPQTPGGVGIGDDGDSAGDTATRAGSYLGTPAYMPPEQAAGASRGADRRSDVFGLGGLLCALLTGKPPFEGPTGESTRVAAARGDTEAAFGRLDSCGADPDAVELCKRCLAARPEERPADAAVVAGEVAGLRAAADERARRAEVDAARAEVRAAEQGRRRRVVARAALAVAAVLALGMGGVTAAWLESRESRRAAEAALAGEVAAKEEAEREQGRAAAQTRQAQQSRAFLEDILASARPEGQGGGLGVNVTLGRAIDAAARKLDDRFTDDPLLEASLRQTIGVSYVNLGRPGDARRMFERALGLRSAALGPDDPGALKLAHNLAVACSDLGLYPEALALSERVLKAREAVAGAADPDTLKSMVVLGNCYSALGRHAEALALKERCRALTAAALGPDHPDALAGALNLAVTYSNLGRYPEALALNEQAAAGYRARLGPDHPDTLRALSNLAASYDAARRGAEALELRARLVELHRAKLGPDHPDTLKSLNALVISYAQAGRHAEAAALGETTLALRRAKLGPDHPDAVASLQNLTNSYAELGRGAEALALRERALELLSAKLGPAHPSALGAAYNLAISYTALGRHAEALALKERGHELLKAKLGADHPTTLASLSGLAGTYADLGRHAEALALEARAFALLKAKLGPDHPDTLVSQTRLAAFTQRSGRAGDALPLFEEAFRRGMAELPANHQQVYHAVAGLARCQFALGRGPEATATADAYLKHVGGKRVDPAWVAGAFAVRNLHPAKVNDAPGCRATAEMCEGLDPAPAGALYDAACFRAIAARAAQATGDPANAEADADRAMAWLARAVAAGYRDAAHMAKDDDLAALRARPDFRKLLASITPETAPMPRVAAPAAR